MLKRKESVESLFARAIELPEPERDAFLAANCTGDSALEHEVRELLDSHIRNQSDPFILDRPIAPSIRATESIAEIAEGAGDVIGRYRLLEKIGEGGMGVVYMAEQIEGVRRRVALKIIKLGMDTRRVIARFEAERQAMALFDHPSITKVFDAGATSTGRPFFVLELVRGTDIVEYCESNQLSLERRLKLFLQVCGAVQHAHQKGIIHRDLKPSNILVTLHDGEPVAKVIDFGIAKAIGQGRLTEKTLFTPYSAMVGTPQYMSPEQAELNGLDVDTRSDIYSMGVLLYQLVTGTPPILESQLKDISPLALHETLRDARIETPSNRILQANRSSISNQSSGRRVPSDIDELDWVVMKSLSRNRTDRYASAHELAADVKRFINSEGVLAAPPSRFRKVRAYVRRHRSTMLIASIVCALLLASTVASLFFGFNASQAYAKLSETHQELSDSVAKLEAAERQIRESAEEQQYASAISIALMRFESEMDYEVFELNRGVLLPTDGDPPTDFGCAIDYDLSDILDIPDSKLHAKSLARVRESMETEQEIIEAIYPAGIQESKWKRFSLGERTQPDRFATGESKTAELVCPGDQRMQLAVGDLLVENRHQFYRYLVDQYRKAFGARDSRVAEALCMLASELNSLGRFDEAEARLREAIAIGDAESQQVAKRLLMGSAE